MLSFPFSSTSSCCFLCWGSWSSNHHFSLECESKFKGWRVNLIHFLMDWDSLVGFSLSGCPLLMVELRVQLVKASMVFPLSAQNLLHETQLLSRLLYFARFGWSQTRVLKFRGKKNTNALLSQSRTWNSWQRDCTCSQHAIQNLRFCSLQSSFLSESRSGVWLRDGCYWPGAALGLCLRLPLTPWSYIALFCTVHWKLCTLSSMENKGCERPWKASWIFVFC